MSAGRLPPWIKTRYRINPKYEQTAAIIQEYNLHTVCQNALCPNQGACFAEGTAAFLILGNVCTRSCRFCAVSKGTPEPAAADEPERIAGAVSLMELDYVVITSVTRDDLKDGGASAFAAVVRQIRTHSPEIFIEILTPDFQGNDAAVEWVASALPDVFNHNIETVPGLYPAVRPVADYERSLHVLRRVKQLQPLIKTKSGLMVGLGEKPEEVAAVLTDLRTAGCDFITIGQYLAPSKSHLPVQEFITPEQFQYYEQLARGFGFEVAAGPLVRSSYRARQMFHSEFRHRDSQY